LSPEVHAPLAVWVKRGGALVFCDADADPYLKVREWWNRDGNNFLTPRQHLFEQLGITDSIASGQFHHVGKGGLIWLRERPVDFSLRRSLPAAAERLVKLDDGEQFADLRLDLLLLGREKLLLGLQHFKVAGLSVHIALSGQFH